ncbi:hypothetical protein J1605_019172 [Eschrichtius robustus]|uniref:MAGE domain-containing protein n=1 Tax=Eschrichtius robustus TaxID=9764 RepID=A0AB34HNU8_ESCRO|nr:hypothetical protein J1605_019172 [Eschrichtius robustus]
MRLRGGFAAGLRRRRRCGRREPSAVQPGSHKVPSVISPSPTPAVPAAVQPLRRGLCSGLHTPRPVYALCTCLPENMLQKPESGGLPILQAEGEMDGGHDSETQALTASQEVAPSPLLRESPEEDLGAVREEGAAEPSITLKGARALAAKTLARRRACLRLDQTVTELVQFLLVKDRKKSPITLSEMVKYIIRDLKDLFPEIIARPAEHLRKPSTLIHVSACHLPPAISHEEENWKASFTFLTTHEESSSKAAGASAVPTTFTLGMNSVEWVHRVIRNLEEW